VAAVVGRGTSKTLSRLIATKTVAKTCFKSFGGETRVLMGDGSTKPISEIDVGDMVLAQDPETGEIGARMVTRLWVHDDELVRLEIDGDIVRTTEDHPFWNDTDKKWQRADELDRGDLVLTADGRRVEVGQMLGSAGRAPAYNLSVQGIHTYHVFFGTDAVLVHNSGCDEFAEALQKRIGGEIKTFKPSDSTLWEAGTYFPNNVEVWYHHTVVVRNGQVFDQFFPKGISIVDWKRMWGNAGKNIDFGF
jgi:hypothetical protein